MHRSPLSRLASAKRPLLVSTLVVTLLIAVFVPIAAIHLPGVKAAAPAPLASRALFFSSDGMRPDLMDTYVGAGAMPTYGALIRQGLKGENGLEQGFPPNTGVGWYTLMAGRAPKPRLRSRGASLLQPASARRTRPASTISMSTTAWWTGQRPMTTFSWCVAPRPKTAA